MIFGLSLLFTISPLPTKVEQTGDPVALADPSFMCTYEDSGNECKEHVQQNFEFFKKMMFVRDEPYTQTEYYLQQIEPAVSSITILIKNESEAYDIETLDESYQLDVSYQEINIVANNSFGVSRALATLVQLVDKHEKIPEDRKGYSIALVSVTDAPQYKWRQLLVDASRHYIAVDSLYRFVDSLAVAKMNVFHFHLIDYNSFPLKFRGEGIKNLFKGAYHPKYFYSIKDLTELSKYAFERGVYLFLEFEVPGHSHSWIKGMPELMAKCPAQDTLDPTNPKVYEAIKAALTELFDAVFNNQEFKIKPIIHLGGDEVNTGCWDNDPAIAKYMADKNITSRQLWQEFHVNLTAAVKEAVGENIHQVFWEEAWNNGNKFATNQIVHLWLYVNKNPICEKGYKVIESTRFYLPRSKPTGTTRYAFQDTWQDFFKADLKQNGDKCKPGQILGGGAAMWSERSWSTLNSQEQLIWPRTIGIAETLWAGDALGNREITQEVTNRVNNLACKMQQLGLNVASITPSVPCFGAEL